MSSIAKIWKNWITPRSEDRDEAFRERTVRVTVAILLIAIVASLVTTPQFFSTEWEAISYENLIILAFFISSAAAFSVAKGYITQAGWLLVITFAVGATGVTFIDGYWGTVSTPAYLITVVLAALVLPLNALVPVGVASVLIFGGVTWLQEETSIIDYISDSAKTQYSTVDPAMNYVINQFFLLVLAALFLRQLRVEFDGRLAAMSESIKETEEARREAERANQAKSQFLANMSHELRTPLNAIIGYVEIMLAGMAGSIEEKQREILDHVHRNGKRLLALINDVLDLAKIEAGRQELNYMQASPREIVDDLVFNMRSLAQTKEITLKATIEDTTPDSVEIDVPKITQILTNLVGNAIKFTPKGGVEVQVDRDSDDGFWRIDVIDTGIGMPKDAANYIFDSFHQVDNTDTREYEGTGLGLAITKQLTEQMGGRISVQTQLGEGSTFTVVLPIAKQGE